MTPLLISNVRRKSASNILITATYKNEAALKVT